MEAAPFWEELLLRDSGVMFSPLDVHTSSHVVGSLRSRKESLSLRKVECLLVFRCC